MSRAATRPSNLPSSAARTSFLPPSHKLLQLAAARRAGRPVHATDLRTTKFYKTKMCPFMQSKRGGGRCSEGFDCGYAHAVEELRNAPDLQRTKWCSKIVNGLRCTDPKCGYAHCAQELQPSKDRQTLKTSLCLFWARDPKFCLNGDKCRFAHGVQDLRKRLALPPRCPTPLISSPETSKKDSYSFVPTHEGLTEKTATPCTDIGNALTTLPTAEAGFDASFDSSPLLPWEATPYGSSHSRIDNALHSRFLSDVRPSGLQDEESFRQLLLQGSAFERKTAAGTSLPNIPPGALRSWRRRCSEYEGEVTDPASQLLTWLPSETLEDVSASENATTHIFEESSFLAGTTAGPEGGDTNYPAFPLFPSQSSPCGETDGGNDRHHHRRIEANPCTLAINLVESRGSFQLPGSCCVSMKDRSQASKEQAEALVRYLTSKSTPHLQQHYHPVSSAATKQTKTHTGKKQVTNTIRCSLRPIPVVSSLSCGPEIAEQTVQGDRKSSCSHFFQEGNAYTENALFETPLPSSLPQGVDVDGQTVPFLPKLQPFSSGVNFRLTGGACCVPNGGMLRRVRSANRGAAGEAERSSNVWTEKDALDTGVLGTNCRSSSEERTPHRPRQKAKRQRAQLVYSTEKSATACQHKRTIPYTEYITQSTFPTVLRRARRVGSNWEHIHSFAPNQMENPLEKKRSISFSDVSPSWHLHTDKETPSVKTLLGSPATAVGLSISKGTLNAHAPPFFPRTLSRYTYCGQGGNAHTDSPKTPAGPLELPTRSDGGRGIQQPRFVSMSSKEGEGTRDGTGVPLWQIRRRVRPAESHQQCRQQQNTTITQESQCSSSTVTPDGVHQLECLNGYTAVQKSRKETLVCLREVDSTGRRGARADNPFGIEEDSVLLSLARVGSVQGSSGYRPATPEMSETSVFYDAVPSSEHASATHFEDACEKRLLPHIPDSVPCHRFTNIPDKHLDHTPFDCGDEVYTAASIPNRFILPSQYKQGHKSVVSYPYSILQEALWQKATTTTEPDRARCAQLVILGRAVDSPREENGR